MKDDPGKLRKDCLSALATARLAIRKDFPYYSSIIYGFVPRMAPGLGTLGVSPGMVLTVDPVWFTNMAKEVDPDIKGLARDLAADAMRAGVLIHEAHHILRGLERIEALVAAGEDPELVNKAFDIPINDNLKDSGVPLPSWAIYSTTFGFKKGLTGEQYLALFKKNPQAQKKAKGGGKGSKGGQGKKGGTPQVGSGACGGCAGNAIDKALEKKFDEEIGRSKADKERFRREGLKALNDAAQAGRGIMPSDLKELLEKGNEKPMVPWQAKCRHVIRNCSGRVISGRSDFSYRRPSRRSWTRGIIRPGMVDRKPEVLFIEDSSGSMGATQLRHGRVEMASAFRALGLDEVWFCDIDADVALQPKRIHINDLAKMPVHGRGGTNFCPGIEIAAKLQPRPEILIYFTDGDGPAPAKAPRGLEVIWCIVPTPYGRRPAKWGHLVLVSNDQELREPYNW